VGCYQIYAMESGILVILTIENQSVARISGEIEKAYIRVHRTTHNIR
jgi:hypothetical protein